MKSHADNSQENKSSIAAAHFEQQASKSDLEMQRFDERPEAVAQRKLQAAANGSPNVKQLNTYQAMANSSTQVRQLQSYQNMVKQSPASDQATPNHNHTGLPDQLKSGVEALSGHSLDDVKVHFNSDKPAQLNALAYAQGTDIHIASGQEKHLSHEAWHVVQQKQGRVRPTVQLKAGVEGNDDSALEKEADEMGQRAAVYTGFQPGREQQLSNTGTSSSTTIQMVKGGVEYTEAGGTILKQWQPSALALGAFNAPPTAVSILGSYVTFYAVPAGTFADGVANNQDFIALEAGLMKLENDVQSAEWIIQRHNQDYTKENFKTRMGEDWVAMWNKREQLRQEVALFQAAHAGEQVVFVQGTSAANLTQASAQRVFSYRPAGNVGSAQITMGYSGSAAMKNIAMSNVSHFLPGGRDDADTRHERVGGTKVGTAIMDNLGGASQWLNAKALHDSLKADMAAVEPSRFGSDIFSTDQLATVQLLVLMDTMARTSTNDDGDGAEASGKNIQRYFPKSMRDSYVREMLGGNVSNGRMDAIRASLTNAIAASVTKFYAAIDFDNLPMRAFQDGQPGRINESVNALAAVANANALNKAARVTAYKNTILGTQVNFAATATAIIGAYTDTSADSSGQRRGDDLAREYEYMVSVKAPKVIPRGGGAVFEDRNEVQIGAGDLGTWNDDNPLRKGIDSLLRGT